MTSTGEATSGRDAVHPVRSVSFIVFTLRFAEPGSVEATSAPCEDQQCGTCWTCQVFGSGGSQDVTSASVGVRSALRIPDAAVRDPVDVQRTHIAIDRFTGGVLPGALYTMEALESGTLTLQVERLTALDARRDDEIRAVFRLVLENLDDGIIGIGGSTARGYGSISVDFGDAESSGGLPSAAEARRVLAQMLEEQ